MNNRSQQHTRKAPKQCIPITTLTKRLAATFDATNWGGDELMTEEDAKNWLDIADEDIAQLVNAGVLKAEQRKYGRYVRMAELLRFLEANPWWFPLRTKKLMQSLRSELEAIAHRKKYARRVARKAVAA